MYMYRNTCKMKKIKISINEYKNLKYKKNLKIWPNTVNVSKFTR